VDIAIRTGFDTLTGRDLFCIAVDQAGDIPEQFVLPSRRFVCLVAWDSSGADERSIQRLAQTLVASGVAYVCAWGAGCSHFHDVVDLELMRVDPESAKPHVMTSWHDDESIEDALWFFLVCAVPDDELLDDCRSGLVLTIGQPAFAALAREALRDPQAFSRRVVGEEPHGAA
jgi:hypothetical protein